MHPEVASVVEGIEIVGDIETAAGKVPSCCVAVAVVETSFAVVGIAAVAEPSLPSGHWTGALRCWTL